MRLLQDRPDIEWLHHQYITLRRSCNHIARELDTHSNTVKRWLVAAGVQLRDNKEAHIEGVRRYWGSPLSIPSKEELIDLYFAKGLSSLDIAKHYGVTRSTISKWFRDYEVKLPRKWKSGRQHPNYVGCGGILGSFWTRIRYGAINREIPFLLTIEEAWEMYILQEGKCALSGLELVLPSGNYGRGGSPATASLDRISSDGGYIRENVQWVHKIVNMMKREFSQNEYINMCCLVAKHVGGLECVT